MEEHISPAEMPVSDTIDVTSGEVPYTLFIVNKTQYGVSSDRVLSISILEPPTPVVNAPPYNLGIMDFRGEMITLIGMRRLFGSPGRGEGLSSFIAELAAEHHEWGLAVLEAAESGGDLSRFSEMNCAMYKWLSGGKTANASLNVHMQRLKSLHERAHKLAVTDVSRFGAAHAELMRALEESVTVYREGLREMLLVLGAEGKTKGIVVDDILSVEYIRRFIELPPNSGNSKYIKTLAKRGKDDTTVQIIDEELVLRL